MSDTDARVPDLRTLLERVEAVAPVDAIDVAADELARMLGAREVSFLIADYSARVLVRLGRSPGSRGGRTQGTENAESVPLAGTVYEEVLRTQQVAVRELGEGAQVTAPVTVRGDVMGAMDLVLPSAPMSGWKSSTTSPGKAHTVISATIARSASGSIGSSSLIQLSCLRRGPAQSSAAMSAAVRLGLAGLPRRG